MKLNKLLFSGMILGALIGSTGFTEEVSAHGYVSNPASRIVKAEENGFGWSLDASQVDIITTPQGVEAPTEKLDSGELNGKLASAGLANYSNLNEQTSTRWEKENMSTGENQFSWHHTATHKTNRHRYYMTKQGWDQNAPLTLENMELITVVGQKIGEDLPAGEGPMTTEDVTHTVTIPEYRSGYHVVYSVWDINDTVMSFYQAIDLNITNGNELLPDVTAPTLPSALKTDNISSDQVDLSWNASIDLDSGVKEYQIFRNGNFIGTSTTTTFSDTTVKAATNYTYTVKAIDRSGNISTESNKLSVTTLTEGSANNQAPTAPKNLHSMKTTEATVSLMWGASTHAEGIKEYQIFRNGTLIEETTETTFKDSNLQAGTTYSYTVKVVANNGLVSKSSNVLSVTTEEITEPEVEGNQWQAITSYVAGSIVSYKEGVYQANWWTQGNAPDQSDAWKLIEGTEKWSANKAYQANEKVTYNGKEYQAAYWIKGETPSTSSIWSVIQ